MDEAGGGKEGAYGTQKMTVVVVGPAGEVVFVERTVGGEERRVEFGVEGWGEGWEGGARGIDG